MKTIAILALLTLAACKPSPPWLTLTADSRPQPLHVTPTAVRPPSLCNDGGGCLAGEACADDGHCGQLCGVDFVCPFGYYCLAFGPAHVDHDCVLACYFTDGGC